MKEIIESVKKEIKLAQTQQKNTTNDQYWNILQNKIELLSESLMRLEKVQ